MRIVRILVEDLRNFDNHTLPPIHDLERRIFPIVIAGFVRTTMTAAFGDDKTWKIVAFGGNGRLFKVLIDARLRLMVNGAAPKVWDILSVPALGKVYLRVQMPSINSVGAQLVAPSYRPPDDGPEQLIVRPIEEVLASLVEAAQRHQPGPT